MQFESVLREFEDKDFAFCRDSFYQGASQSPDMQIVHQDFKKPGFRARFERLLPFADIYLATHPEGEPIYGWIAVTNLESYSIVWWIYVKHGYRRLGFGRQLWACVRHPKVFFPFRSIHADKLHKKAKAELNPFVFEEMCLENQKNTDL